MKEILHPDYELFRDAFRESVLDAMDITCGHHTVKKPEDKDLPALFPALDAMAYALWTRTKGYAA